MTAPFMPKQAIPFDGALLQELQGNVSDTIARDLLKELPPLSPSSIIHDNGCGYGAVTQAIMHSNPPIGTRINATDANPMFIAQLQAAVSANPDWAVKIDTMDACNLTFPDAAFDLSFTTFVFAGLTDDLAAARHILRTLKPGGTGVIAVWQDMPWYVALENAHHVTRGAHEPMAPFLSKRWYKKEKLSQVLTEAGWNNVQYVEKAAWLELGTDLKRWARIAWTFLATPVGGWQQRDEERWDEAVEGIVGELETSEWHKVEDGVHKIRMVADVAIGRK